MNTYMETPRLILRDWKEEDIPVFTGLNSNDQVMEFFLKKLSYQEYAKKTLGLKELYSFTSLPNKRSERVMQKIGMVKSKEFDHPLVSPDHPLCRHVLYKISLINR